MFEVKLCGCFLQ